MSKFTDFLLAPEILKAVDEASYTTPTPIQEKTIPLALEGHDILGIAQTGTGKTASFILPIISHLAKGRARARMPRSLVLTPTRELAIQIGESFDKYSKYTRLTKALLIGGVSFKEQEVQIGRAVDVLIATPGRLLDHFERGRLLLTGVQILAVDEADRMLDMGFIDDIERIFKLTPGTRQRLFFSATMAPEIDSLANKFLSTPKRVEAARAATTLETITQGVFHYKARNRRKVQEEKLAVLCKMLAREGDECTNAIIFCNRKTEVDNVARALKAKGFSAEPIHGDLAQRKRMEVLDGFRANKVRFLCASDVAARGLDIPNVSHVFNFDVPINPEDYVHRIGRTGRAGRTGKTLTIASEDDQKYLSAVENLIQQKIPCLNNPAPSAGESPTAKTKPDNASRNAPNMAPKSTTSKPKPNEASKNASNMKGIGSGDNLPPFLAHSFKERQPKKR